MQVKSIMTRRLIVWCLTLSQTTRVWRRQFQIWWKWQEVFQRIENTGKRRNFFLRAISPFLQCFQKLLLQIRKNEGFFGKGLTPFSVLFQLYHGGLCSYPCFPGILFTGTPHKILSKPLVAFPHNHCRNNGQRWERNESCRNDYHQSSERILGEPGDRTSESAYSWSPVLYPTDWAMGLGIFC